MFLLTFWNKQNVILLDNNNVEMLYVTETGITKEDASHKTNIDTLLCSVTLWQETWASYRGGVPETVIQVIRFIFSWSGWVRCGYWVFLILKGFVWIRPVLAVWYTSTWIGASFYGWINLANIFYWWYCENSLDNSNKSSLHIGG